MYYSMGLERCEERMSALCRADTLAEARKQVMPLVDKGWRVMGQTCAEEMSTLLGGYGKEQSYINKKRQRIKELRGDKRLGMTTPRRAEARNELVGLCAAFGTCPNRLDPGDSCTGCESVAV